ncbi:hypothetical protein H4R33_001261 [Dimargaris cristalligena]|nr:hypothetical protein H4R33_001261 [Dimargaris cristalligena]
MRTNQLNHFCLILATVGSCSYAASVGNITTTELPPNPKRECVSPDVFDPNVDYYPEKWQSSDEDSFTVKYFNHYKEISNHITDENFLLVKCGTPTPSGYNQDQFKIFETPVERIGVAQNSTQSFLYKLGYANVIPIEGSSAAPHVDSSDKKSMFKQPYDRFIGLPSRLNDRQSGMVDIAFTGHFMPEDKYATVNESTERTPLKRSEWIGFYSLFVDREGEANRRVEMMNDNYRCMKNKLKEVLETKNLQPLKVAWARYEEPKEANDHKETWILTQAPFKVALTGDAGAEMINKGITSKFTNKAAMRFALTQADILIDETYGTHTIEAVLQHFGIEDTPQDAQVFKFIYNRMVFREDGLRTATDGNGWYHTAVSSADVLLQDFIRAVYMPSSKQLPRLWFRNLAREEVLSVMKTGRAENGLELEKLRPYGCENIQWSDVTVRSKPIPDNSGSSLHYTTVWGLTIVVLTATFSTNL